MDKAVTSGEARHAMGARRRRWSGTGRTSATWRSWCAPRPTARWCAGHCRRRPRPTTAAVDAAKYVHDHVRAHWPDGPPSAGDGGGAAGQRGGARTRRRRRSRPRRRSRVQAPAREGRALCSLRTEMRRALFVRVGRVARRGEGAARPPDREDILWRPCRTTTAPTGSCACGFRYSILEPRPTRAPPSAEHMPAVGTTASCRRCLRAAGARAGHEGGARDGWRGWQAGCQRNGDLQYHMAQQVQSAREERCSSPSKPRREITISKVKLGLLNQQSLTTSTWAPAVALEHHVDEVADRRPTGLSSPLRTSARAAAAAGRQHACRLEGSGGSAAARHRRRRRRADYGTMKAGA